MLPTVCPRRNSGGILGKCTHPVTPAHTSCGSHLRVRPAAAVAPKALCCLTQFPSPPSSYVLSARVPTVLIYSAHLDIQGTLQTGQAPARGSLPRSVFHLQHPPFISARPIETFASFRLFSWGYLITRSPRLSCFHSLCPTRPVALAPGCLLAVLDLRFHSVSTLMPRSKQKVVKLKME